ncbi:BZ3500_MvSof-1268-A1-R1_Chr2-1g04414 [Microbotryum saponariae]|uniref:BZ3500_MvSof-1268-A1-R1_Chr2-1g04414 protein n=1 Tax=Microbotryum saponariae TaxID=289078 RepID=A0A2X0M9S0_9BASI|nr:BZ3500_MvSof-1268-A1-R1_Chr2-1g04414 [Microbotryum saponariae]SCZ91631.1 BZ3501_MvSof-1269-A2-R1_Chr2-1g04070 [Microbotryum saponariae]
MGVVVEQVEQVEQVERVDEVMHERCTAWVGRQCICRVDQLLRVDVGDPALSNNTVGRAHPTRCSDFRFQKKTRNLKLRHDDA